MKDTDTTTRQTPDATAAWARTGVERRLSIRRKIPLHTVVNDEAVHRWQGVTRDLSMDGAFVEIEADVPARVPVNAVIRVGADGVTELKVLADVVRVEAGGAALRFRPYDNWTYTALTNLLYAR